MCEELAILIMVEMLRPRTAIVINYLITHSDVYYGNCMIVPVGRAGSTNVQTVRLLLKPCLLHFLPKSLITAIEFCKRIMSLSYNRGFSINIKMHNLTKHGQIEK